MPHPSTSSAYGIWSLNEVRDAERGDNWPSIPPVFAVLDASTADGGTLDADQLDYSGPGAWRRINSTINVSTGKWYWEVNIYQQPFGRNINGSYHAFGFGLPSETLNGQSPSVQTTALIVGDASGFKNFSGSWQLASPTFNSGDILSIAVDLDANTFAYRQNNTQFSSGTIGGTVGRELTPVILSYSTLYGRMRCNFGQDSSFDGRKTAQNNTDANGIGDFYYAPPSGYLALADVNL